MSGEIENAARSMMSSPQGLKIIKGLDKYNTAMNTESGRQRHRRPEAGGPDRPFLRQGAGAGAAAESAQLPGRGGAGGKGHRGHGSVTRYG